MHAAFCREKRKHARTWSYASLQILCKIVAYILDRRGQTSCVVAQKFEKKKKTKEKSRPQDTNGGPSAKRRLLILYIPLLSLSLSVKKVKIDALHGTTLVLFFFALFVAKKWWASSLMQVFFDCLKDLCSSLYAYTEPFSPF